MTEILPEAREAADEWEIFCDTSYFDMWCLRPVGETRWGGGVHVISREGAENVRDFVIEAILAERKRCQKEEMAAATGTLAEAIKDLRRAGFLDAAELLERKTMPETVAIFKENAQAIRSGT